MTLVAVPNRQTLRGLASWDGPLVVSVFLPVDFSQPQATENIAKALRHAAQLATATLTSEHGMDPGAATAFVGSLTRPDLLDDVPTAAHGLAVFVSADHSQHLPLPMEVGPAVEVGDGVDLLRLLPAFSDDIDFHVLTIDQKGAHLYRANHFYFEQVPVSDMPGSIDDELWYIRREPDLSRHGSVGIHGTGGGQDLRKDDIRKFIHRIDRAVAPILVGCDSPLVVVGVEYETAMFINHTAFRHVCKTPIHGSPDTMTSDEIHRRAWNLVAHATVPHGALAQLGELAGTGKAALDPAEVLTASEQGSVQDLMVIQSIANATNTSPIAAADRRMIVNAVNQGFLHQAEIHVVDDDALPNGSTMSAVLRY
jgi:hypothetical protein